VLLGPIAVAYAIASLPDGPNRPCSDSKSGSGAARAPAGSYGRPLRHGPYSSRREEGDGKRGT
jgi:hypothetical protein